MHHSIRLNKNTDVMRQDAYFITADFLYMFRASCAHHQEYKIMTQQPPVHSRILPVYTHSFVPNMAKWGPTCNHNYLYRWLPCRYFVLLMMGAWRPKHVEKICSNKVCILLHHVDVFLTFYFDSKIIGSHCQVPRTLGKEIALLEKLTVPLLFENFVSHSAESQSSSPRLQQSATCHYSWARSIHSTCCHNAAFISSDISKIYTAILIILGASHNYAAELLCYDKMWRKPHVSWVLNHFHARNIVLILLLLSICLPQTLQFRMLIFNQKSKHYRPHYFWLFRV